MGRRDTCSCTLAPCPVLPALLYEYVAAALRDGCQSGGVLLYAVNYQVPCRTCGPRGEDPFTC